MRRNISRRDYIRLLSGATACTVATSGVAPAAEAAVPGAGYDISWLFVTPWKPRPVFSRDGRRALALPIDRATGIVRELLGAPSTAPAGYVLWCHLNRRVPNAVSSTSFASFRYGLLSVTQERDFASDEWRIRWRYPEQELEQWRNATASLPMPLSSHGPSLPKQPDISAPFEHWTGSEWDASLAKGIKWVADGWLAVPVPIHPLLPSFGPLSRRSIESLLNGLQSSNQAVSQAAHVVLTACCDEGDTDQQYVNGTVRVNYNGMKVVLSRGEEYKYALPFEWSHSDLMDVKRFWSDRIGK